MSLVTQHAAHGVEDRGPVVLAITIAFVAASTVFVLLRLVSRIGVVNRVTWDDYFIILAWILAVGFSFSIGWGVHSGLGLHEVDIPPEKKVSLGKAQYAFSVLYNPVLMATKTSILIFYLSLSQTQHIFRWGTYTTLFVVNVAGLALTILNIVQCHPVEAVFEAVAPAYAACSDIITLYLSSAPVNIITDLAMLFLPMPILTNLRLPRKQKIILIITFSFGAFVAAVDVVRIAYLQAAFQTRIQEFGTTNTTSPTILEQDDFSWYASLSFMWSAIEVHVGILCACVPALKPLVAKILPRMLRDRDDPPDMTEFNNDPAKLQGVTKANTNGAPPLPISPTSPTRLIEPARQNNSVETADDLDLMDFLTMPDFAPSAARTNTRASVARSDALSSPRNPTELDFYNLKQTKPMTKLTMKESLFPLALVTILFFMWGFAYGILNILNSQFSLITNLSAGQDVGLHAAYFAAYLVGPLTFGRIVFMKWGFKATFITGLCIYGIGTLIFWPSAVLDSFPAFIISNFIVGLGVSTLEVAANPFIALCGPPEHAETRLNLSQGVQAIGSVVSALLAKKVLFKGVTNTLSLIDVQWTYLGIALFDVLLAVAFYYSPIPEATDEDFEEVAERRQVVNSQKVGKFPVVYITLGLGVFSLFCYVGGQEAAAGAFQKYVSTVEPNASIDSFSYQSLSASVFAVGRFLSALASFFFQPRWVLLVLFTGMIITSSLAMSLTGSAGSAMVVLFEFFQSGTFPILFAISLRGLGSFTKSGAIYLTAAISGGAIFPVIMDPIIHSHGIRYAYCVIIASSIFGALFPLYLALVPAAKRQVDPMHKRRHPVLQTESRESEMGRLGRLYGGISKRRKQVSDTLSSDLDGAEEKQVHLAGSGHV